MKKLLAFFVLYWFASIGTHACTCNYDENSGIKAWLKHSYQNSSYVLIAKVTSSKIVNSVERHSEIRSDIRISNVFKGDDFKWDYLSTDNNEGNSCRTYLTTGMEYMLFLNSNKVSHCTPKLTLTSKSLKQSAIEDLLLAIGKEY